jgi:D-beta-D-heptose 7-phosphate kinase/D-beta-D-heptose 1-phosphate adenosyltransferase
MLPQLHSVLNLLESGFAQVKILVVGDVMLDRYLLGEVERISPEAPVPVLRHAQRFERPGGAANVAMNLAGLGCQTFLCGFWGADSEQAELAQLLGVAGIDTTGVVSSSQPTISKTRIVARTQQLLRLDIEGDGAMPLEESARLEARAVELVKKVHAVVLSDYSKGALTYEVCASIIRAARALNIPVLVDPKTSDLSKYSGATTLCVNLRELAVATGVDAYDTDRLLAAARVQMEEHDFKFLTIKMGNKGITVLGPDGDLHSPARAREVCDISGAGDSVIATLAAALAGGLQTDTAIDLANLAAGIVVGKIGTVPVAQHELIATLTTSCGYASVEKILDFDRVRLRVAEWRAAGETVVFTSGCFDLLRVAHLSLLEECRRFGSKLVLGLNTDSSVTRLKGPSRPFVGENERARAMAALAAVDAVVLFEEDAPLELIRALKPNVLVKGGDFTIATVQGHEDVLAAGGRVEIVPTIKDFATTGIWSRIPSAPEPPEMQAGDFPDTRGHNVD